MQDDTAFDLEEFRALRAEISQRSAAQNSLVQLNLTGIAAVVGVFFSPLLDPRILLIVPVISPGLGLLWLDNAKAVERLGLYIKDVLTPRLSPATGLRGPSYEEFLRREGLDRRGTYNVALTLGIFAMFFIVPVVALTSVFVAPVRADQLRISIAFAVVGVLILLIFMLDFCGWMVPRTWPRRRAEPTTAQPPDQG